VAGLALAILLLPSAQAGGAYWNVQFVETGLAADSSWSVTLNGVTHVSHSDVILFHAAPGSYSFSVGRRPGYTQTPASGTLTVSGGTSSVGVTFTAPGTPASIVSNFNGNSIPGGDWIWFNSVIKPASAIPAGGVAVRLSDQTITLGLPNGTALKLSVPDARVVWRAGATVGTTRFDTSAYRWVTTSPTGFTDNVFAAGLAYQVPAGGLPGGIQTVNWSAVWGTTTGTFSVHWQWAAAVYTSFTDQYNQLDVKPLHSTSLDKYHSGDQAGTPEAFTAYVIGGARGGGGANYTGSYSSTLAITPRQD
jgi:hypothetical protein